MTVLVPLQSGFLGSFPFDPLGQDSPAMAEREIKNARLGALRTCTCLFLCNCKPCCAAAGFTARPSDALACTCFCAAMMAFVGFASVYANRGMTPLQALNAHVADPANMNSEFQQRLHLCPQNVDSTVHVDGTKTLCLRS